MSISSTGTVMGTRSQIPRPWVAMRSRRLPATFCSAMSKTATRGSPVLYGLQVAPPSVEL